MSISLLADFFGQGLFHFKWRYGCPVAGLGSIFSSDRRWHQRHRCSCASSGSLHQQISQMESSQMSQLWGVSRKQELHWSESAPDA